MPFSDPERHLRDILESIERVNEFIGDADFNAYQADEKTKAAVERKMQVLTEANIRLEMEGPEAYRRLTGKGIVAWATSCGIPIIGFPMRSFGIQ